MDGPHLYRSKRDALKDWKKWEKEAKSSHWDSFWEMMGPAKYILEEDLRLDDE
jgi:hypothetical protein